VEEEEEKTDPKGALVPTLAMLAPLDAYFPSKVDYVASSVKWAELGQIMRTVIP
jgi:hypothetical protein